MSFGSWLATGFAGTVLLTLIMAGSQVLGLTRMSIPYLLGAMFVADRDRAHLVGIAVHLVNGWIFSLVYVALFHAAGIFTWWAGALVGLVHGAFVLAVAMPALPGLHPRMASATSGPTVTAPLEPPGFLARNYGTRTPITVLVAHVVFGAVVGGFYRPG
jgi:hypothetical protein